MTNRVKKKCAKCKQMHRELYWSKKCNDLLCGKCMSEVEGYKPFGQLHSFKGTEEIKRR